MNDSADINGDAGMKIVAAQEAQDVTGGLCGPMFYLPLSIHDVGVGGCGGPTKDAQGSCNLTPILSVCIGPFRQWYYRDCLECGENCGSYQYIDPSSCSG